MTLVREDRNETTVTPRKSITLKRDGINIHTLQDDIIHGYPAEGKAENANHKLQIEKS